MEKFILENSKLVSEILKGTGLSKEKLELIKEIKNNENFKFEICNACPMGIYLKSEINYPELSSLHIYERPNKLRNYLLSKGFKEMDFEITLMDSTYSEGYKVLINKGKSSELLIYLKQK